MLRLLYPAFRSYLAALTRPVSEVSMKTKSGRQHDRRQYSTYPAIPVRHFAAKKNSPQARVNINTVLVEDIVSLEEVNEDMKSVMEALKDNFNKTLNIRTAPGSLDHITVVTADGKLAVCKSDWSDLHEVATVDSGEYGQLSRVYSCSYQGYKRKWNASEPRSGRKTNSGNYSYIPKVTREHREMLVKLTKQNTNEAKENLQKILANAMNKLKKSKDKASEDTIRLIEKQISQMADVTVAELDWHLVAKIKELLG